MRQLFKILQSFVDTHSGHLLAEAEKEQLIKLEAALERKGGKLVNFVVNKVLKIYHLLFYRVPLPLLFFLR